MQVLGAFPVPVVSGVRDQLQELRREAAWSISLAVLPAPRASVSSGTVGRGSDTQPRGLQ